jgi:hypothetical protein
MELRFSFYRSENFVTHANQSYFIYGHYPSTALTASLSVCALGEQGKEGTSGSISPFLPKFYS